MNYLDLFSLMRWDYKKMKSKDSRITNEEDWLSKSKVIEDSEVEEGSDSDDEEMAMYARRFRRFIKKNKP